MTVAKSVTVTIMSYSWKRERKVEMHKILKSRGQLGTISISCYELHGPRGSTQTSIESPSSRVSVKRRKHVEELYSAMDTFWEF